jgi:multisubunit Na+/H+ antiporter MnhF subunit
LNLGSIGSATGSNPYTYSRAGITSFSPFAIMNNNAIVPMQSIKLSVIKTSNSNKLNWNIIATDAAQIEIQNLTTALISYLSTNKYLLLTDITMMIELLEKIITD